MYGTKFVMHNLKLVKDVFKNFCKKCLQKILEKTVSKNFWEKILS